MLSFANFRFNLRFKLYSTPVFRGGSMAFMSSVENRKTMLIFINFALLVISLLLIGGTTQISQFHSFIISFLISWMLLNCEI